MLLLDLVLDVACCACSHRMAVTVKCEGDGLADPRTRSLFCLSCPLCKKANHVIFAPESGEVIEVMDELTVVRDYEPSMN